MMAFFLAKHVPVFLPSVVQLFNSLKTCGLIFVPWDSKQLTEFCLLPANDISDETYALFET